MEFEQSSERIPEGHTEETHEEFIASQTAKDAAPERSIVESCITLGISVAQDAQITSSIALGGMVAGNDLAVSDSVSSAFVAGNNLHLQDSTSAMMVAGGDAHLKDGFIGILVAGGDTHLDGDSKLLMTSQQAAIFGVAAGLVLALFSLLIRRKRTG